MTKKYDNDNVFAKILRGEIPCKKIWENEHVLAFHDISPQRPVHIVVIPKGAYLDIDDFTARADIAEQAALMQALGQVAREAGLEEQGYRVITNKGEYGGQEVPHLHFHIVGGAPCGKMLV